jgi:hypothetical protein
MLKQSTVSRPYFIRNIGESTGYRLPYLVFIKLIAIGVSEQWLIILGKTSRN